MTQDIEEDGGKKDSRDKYIKILWSHPTQVCIK